MRISYAIPVCNELVEITKLLNFLKKYISLPQTQRELDEKLEQLRILDLENIHITCVNNEILGVDTKEDLDRVNQIIQEHE